MDRYQSTTGIVINRRSIKESDLLITLLTPRKGKIVALAKGVKSIKSSRLGSLQMGNIVKVNLYQKEDFIWISESQTISPFLQDKKSLTQLNLLFYFLEIINRLIAENQHIEGAYEISQNIIEAINKNQVTKYIENEIKLLSVLGFGITPEIIENFDQKDYKNTQKLIKQFFESIIEKPLESNKLFK